MCIIHTIAGLRLDYGGPSRSVPSTADAQGNLGYDVHVIDVAHSSSMANRYPEKANTLTLNAVGFMQYRHLFRSLSNLLGVCRGGSSSVVVHDHGLWRFEHWAIARSVENSGAKLVISPRGMLSAWGLNRRRIHKWLVWKLWQRRAIEIASGMHATSEEELEDIRSAGFMGPICLAPNGVDFPSEMPVKVATGQKRVLFLSRLHPKKGVIELLHAWARTPAAVGCQLVVAGPEEGGYGKEVRAAIRSLGLQSSVLVVGALMDSDKWQMFANSDLFVLPSHNENFGIVIAEAMAAGLPVITTTGTPWQCIRDHRMGWWIDLSIESLAATLQIALSCPSGQLEEMGQRGASYVNRNFSWSQTAERLCRFYCEDLGMEGE